MHLNVSKIDERIQKLQDLKRIAADPELLRMISDFIVFENEQAEKPAAAKAAAAATVGAPQGNEADIVNQLLRDSDSGSSVWARKRA